MAEDELDDLCLDLFDAGVYVAGEAVLKFDDVRQKYFDEAKQIAVDDTKVAINAYTTNKIILELEKDCEHTFNKAYGFCTKCGSDWRQIEIKKSNRIAELRKTL